MFRVRHFALFDGAHSYSFEYDRKPTSFSVSGHCYTWRDHFVVGAEFQVTRQPKGGDTHVKLSVDLGFVGLGLDLHAWGEKLKEFQRKWGGD